MSFISEINKNSKMKKMETITYTFVTHRDGHGELVAIENYKDVPFQIQRIYYMYGMMYDDIRGNHAHRTLKQVLICIHGSCKVKLNDGKDSLIISLDKPNEGIYIPNIIWREITEFSPDAVLLVLASEPYNEVEYIRNYDDFLKLVNGDTDAGKK